MEFADGASEAQLLDGQLLDGPVVPRPEINRLLFPPRGEGRPVLRQVLSEPGLKKEFLGQMTEWPKHKLVQRKRPDPRDDPGIVKDSEIMGLFQQLDGQKRQTHSKSSPAFSGVARLPKAVGSNLPAHQAIEHMQANGQSYREGLSKILDRLDRKSTQSAKLKAERHEMALTEQKIKLDFDALQSFAKRSAERDPWNYCDPAGYFENPLKVERDKSHTNVKVDVLQGIYDTADKSFRPPHDQPGGWDPATTNERGVENDTFARPPKHYAKEHGKPEALTELDRKIRMKERERLIADGDTSCTGLLAAIDADLERLRAQQAEETRSWLAATVPPGKVPVRYQEKPPGPGPRRPAQLSPSEAFFAQRLDRELAENERLEAKEKFIQTSGTLRRRRMEATCEAHSSLARGKGKSQKAWNENDEEKLAQAKKTFYSGSPREDKLPVSGYFSEYAPYMPGEHTYQTGLEKYIQAPERATSVERNFIAGDGENRSFWKGPPGGAVSGTMEKHAIAQVLLCPRGCKSLLSKSARRLDVTTCGGTKLDKSPCSNFLRKNARGGAPCRNASPTNSAGLLAGH